MILISFSTRPEYYKVKPIIDFLKENKVKHHVLHIGQHTDLMPNDIEWHRLMKPDGKNMGQFANFSRLDSLCLTPMFDSEWLFQYNYDLVLVQGDTASAFGLALAAFNNDVPIAHVEAGMRTYSNNPYPEEAYRKMISCMASLHFCPTEIEYDNLVSEGTLGNIYITGNTVIDTMPPYSKPEYNNAVLCTMHRRENKEYFSAWIERLDEIAGEYPSYNFLFIQHPSNDKEPLQKVENLNVISPLKRKELLNILYQCAFVITDSGGLQEETAYFEKRVVVCRDKTERRQGVLMGQAFLAKDPTELEETIDICMNYKKPLNQVRWIYGDGKASEKIGKILMKYTIGGKNASDARTSG